MPNRSQKHPSKAHHPQKTLELAWGMLCVVGSPSRCVVSPTSAHLGEHRPHGTSWHMIFRAAQRQQARNTRVVPTGHGLPEDNLCADNNVFQGPAHCPAGLALKRTLRSINLPIQTD